MGRGGAHLPGVDGLRGAATVMIAVGHAWFLGGLAPLDEGPLQAVVAATWIAVDVFFVLSAVLLLAPVAAGGDLGRPREFYRRRVARLVPLYLLALLGSMLLAGWLRTGAPVPPSPGGWGVLLAHLLFVHDAVYAGAGHVGFGVDTVVWTLGVEAGFYLLLPWVARWWVAHPFAGLALGVAVARGWSALVHAAPAGAQQQLLLETPSYAAHFAAGMTLAVLLFHPRYRGVADAVRAAAGPCKALGLVWLLAFMVQVGGRGLAGEARPFEHVLGTLPALPGIVLLVAGAVSARSRVLDGAVARYLADTSYSVYLLHLPAIEVAVRLGVYSPHAGWPFLVLLAGPVGGAFVVGRWVYRYVEVPARAWVNGLGRSTVRVPAPLVQEEVVVP